MRTITKAENTAWGIEKYFARAKVLLILFKLTQDDYVK
jgi:hypothetical protein